VPITAVVSRRPAGPGRSPCGRGGRPHGRGRRRAGPPPGRPSRAAGPRGRAACGATSPMKPMVPAEATAVALSSTPSTRNPSPARGSRSPRSRGLYSSRETRSSSVRRPPRRRGPAPARTKIRQTRVRVVEDVVEAVAPPVPRRFPGRSGSAIIRLRLRLRLRPDRTARRAPVPAPAGGPVRRRPRLSRPRAPTSGGNRHPGDTGTRAARAARGAAASRSPLPATGPARP
jgi:hypothetical protein